MVQLKPQRRPLSRALAEFGPIERILVSVRYEANGIIPRRRTAAEKAEHPIHDISYMYANMPTECDLNRSLERIVHNLAAVRYQRCEDNKLADAVESGINVMTVSALHCRKTT